MTEPIVYSPPPLLDTHRIETARPNVQRTFGVTTQRYGSNTRLVYSTGNELAARIINNPEDPMGATTSRFSWLNGGPVQPAGDRDYNLAGFAVCDNGRYGIAGFYEMGTIIFSFDATGRFSRFAHHPNANTVNGATYIRNSQQYIVVNNLSGSGCGSTAVRWRVDDVDHLVDPQCLKAFGGRNIPATGGIVVGNYLYLADDNRDLHIFRIFADGSLGYVQTPGHATMLRSSGIAVVKGFMVTAAANLYIWDLRKSLADPRLMHTFRPMGRNYSACALRWPILWASPVGGPCVTYNIADPAHPVPLVTDAWDETHENNTWYGTLDMGATFTPDGNYLFASRYSTLQRFRIY